MKDYYTKTLPETIKQRYLAQAGKAYDTFLKRGPFYGSINNAPGETPPSFLVPVEPQWLPERYEEELRQLGKDVAKLASVLPLLPENDKKILGDNLSFATPISWRLDTILTKNGIKVNEIQIADGADALMVTEQLAYGLQTLETSTVKYLIDILKARCPQSESGKPLKIALVRENKDSKYIQNSLRMGEFLSSVSNGTVQMDVLFKDELNVQLLNQYQGIINYGYITPQQFAELGINESKLLSAGDFSALGSKGLFPLLFDKIKRDFWIKTLGEETYFRLKRYFIPSSFITTREQIVNAQKSGNCVVKAYQAANQEDTRLLDSGKSVFGPWMPEWQNLEGISVFEMFDRGMKFMAQDYQIPLRLKTLLRANKGKDVQRKLRYNRFCIKYVQTSSDSPIMTALETTLGEDVKPTGRDTAFTPVLFAKRRGRKGY